MSGLLEAAQNAPKFDGVNWVQHKDAYFVLLEKGYTQKAAVGFIGDYLELSDDDRRKLRSTSSHWRKAKEGKDRKGSK